MPQPALQVPLSPRPPDPVDVRVSRQLRRRRLALGFPTEFLDLVIGASTGTVAKLEKGTRPVGASHLFRLSCALGVDVGYFFSDDDTGPLPPEPCTTARDVSEAKQFLDLYAKLDQANVRESVRNLVRTLANGETPAVSSLMDGVPRP